MSFSVPADLLSQITFSASAEGAVEQWNQAWTDYTGVPAWGAIGWDWLNCVEEKDRSTTRESLIKCYTRTQAFQQSVSLWHEKARRYTHQLLRCRPDLDLAGNAKSWVGTITEAAAEAQLMSTGGRTESESNQRIDTLEAELKLARQELQDFAYASSHDLREPVRMITSYLNLLERRYKTSLDQNAIEYINYAVSGAARMNRLIDDLLAYSRVVGGESFAMQSVNLNAIVQWVMMNLDKEIKEADATVSFENLPTLNADENRLVLALQHVVANSLKFRRSDPPHIDISAYEEDHTWHVDVQDNGMGFDPKYAERIFGVFKRLQGREYEGSGMGLAIARKVIERHGGQMWADSIPGTGTKISFTIPI